MSYVYTELYINNSNITFLFTCVAAFHLNEECIYLMLLVIVLMDLASTRLFNQSLTKRGNILISRESLKGRRDLVVAWFLFSPLIA